MPYDDCLEFAIGVPYISQPGTALASREDAAHLTAYSQGGS